MIMNLIFSREIVNKYFKNITYNNIIYLSILLLNQYLFGLCFSKLLSKSWIIVSYVSIL
jgi:hypothetical protein